MSGLVDISHYFGDDLAASNVGNLQAVGGTVRGQQRVLRRLLTNAAETDSTGAVVLPADYIWHPDYGASLPRWVGRTADYAKIRAIIRGQMQAEAAVAQSPEPTVIVGAIPNSAGGGFAVSVAYTDADSGAPAYLSFNVTE